MRPELAIQLIERLEIIAMELRELRADVAKLIKLQDARIEQDSAQRARGRNSKSRPGEPVS